MLNLFRKPTHRLAQHRYLRPLQRWFSPSDASSLGRLLLLYAGVGVVVGVCAIGFHWTVAWAEHLFLDRLAGYRAAIPAGEHHLSTPSSTAFTPWVLLVLPALGAGISALLVWRAAPEAAGAGMANVIDSYHGGGHVRRRVFWVKTLASALVIGCGGSAGREGPIAQIGSSLGSFVARLLRISRQERRTLVAAGAAAGVGALFHAPVASALFMAEVLYRRMELEHEVIVPSLIASIVSYTIYSIEFSWRPLFRIDDFMFSSPLELGPYLLLAIVLAISGRLFVRTYFLMAGLFRRLPWSALVAPVVGGLGAGAIGLLAPETLGASYGSLQAAIDGELGLWSLAGLAVGKMWTATLTSGAGASGGLFGPSMVIGGLIGGAMAMGVHEWMPAIAPPYAAFVVIGMGGFFSAISNAPISVIILITEMTGNYHLLVPAMWVCVIAWLLTADVTLFDTQKDTRLDSHEHLMEAVNGVARRLTVGDAIRNQEHEAVVTARPDTPLSELRRRFAHTHHASFPITREDGELCGMVDEEAMRQAMEDPDLPDIIVAGDVLAPADPVTLEDSLHSALHKLVSSHRDELAVVERTDRTCLVGCLSRRDIVAFLDERLHEGEVT